MKRGPSLLIVQPSREIATGPARQPAKARARKQGTGYLHRIFAGLENAGPGLSFVTIKHDPECDHPRGGACDCVPDIYRSTGNRFETINPEERVTVERRN